MWIESDHSRSLLNKHSIEKTIEILKEKAILSAKYTSGDKTYVYRGGWCYEVNNDETNVNFIGRDEDSIKFRKHFANKGQLPLVDDGNGNWSVHMD
jgi:hypothetical protein